MKKIYFYSVSVVMFGEKYEENRKLKKQKKYSYKY